MTRQQRLRPLQPVFDEEKRMGSIQVGNTWPVTPPVSEYDIAVLNDIGAIWYSVLEPFGSISLGSPPDWPSVATLIADDAGSEAVWGYQWLTAWRNESGLAPATYDDVLDELGTILSVSSELTSDNAPPFGGTVTDLGGYRYHTYTVGDIWWSGVVSDPIDIDALIVAGGGSGGRTGAGYAGGGGAGEALTLTSYTFTDTSAVVTIGAGGTVPPSGNNQGNDGNDTTFGALVTALGGGGGGSPGISSGDGRAGGSGGGGSAATTAIASAGGTSGAGGNDGGDALGSTTAAQRRAGGGGGASGPGQDGVPNTVSGNGGPGIEWPAGSGTFYAGGGGGGRSGGSTAGGIGGGGAGGAGGTAGTANTGGGGGGAGNVGTNAPGAGGSGILIIRYPI